MDLAQQLVRSCVRAFYEDSKHILVVDALIIHSAYASLALVAPTNNADNVPRLRDDDMAYLLGMQSKELHKYCGRLKEDRFIAVYGFLSDI
jgi:transcription initiation factor TFIIE subunit alpha